MESAYKKLDRSARNFQGWQHKWDGYELIKFLVPFSMEDSYSICSCSSADAVRQIVQSQMGRCCTDLHLDIRNVVSLEKADKFCYLGDMLDADG